MPNKGYRLNPSADAGCIEVTCRRIAGCKPSHCGLNNTQFIPTYGGFCSFVTTDAFLPLSWR
jgi:hypothetical protein